MIKYIKTFLILATISLFIIACTQTGSDTGKISNNTNKAENMVAEATPSPDELASGRGHYKEQCASCHKENGTGGEVVIEGKTLNADNLTTDKMKKMPDEKYIKYMVNGIPDEGMPSFKDVLSDDEMKEVVKYIRQEIQK